MQYCTGVSEWWRWLWFTIINESQQLQKSDVQKYSKVLMSSLCTIYHSTNVSAIQKFFNMCSAVDLFVTSHSSYLDRRSFHHKDVISASDWLLRRWFLPTLSLTVNCSHRFSFTTPRKQHTASCSNTILYLWIWQSYNGQKVNRRAWW